MLQKKQFCTTELLFSFGKKIGVNVPSPLLSNCMSFFSSSPFRALQFNYYNSKKQMHTTLLTLQNLLVTWCN